MQKETYPHILFDFDESWELDNLYTACTKESDYGLRGGKDAWFRDLPEEIVRVAKGAKDKKDGIRALRPIFDRFVKTSVAQEEIKKSIEFAEHRWKKREAIFFPALSAMLEVPMGKFEKKYRAHLTFTRRCPFNKNEFMFSRLGRIENVATHEIMHIEFLKAYEPHCKEKGLTDLEIQHLKEILTVLLNEDGGTSSVRSQKDLGYTKHQSIREEVAALYRKHITNKTSFTEFLDQVIDLVKQAQF